MRLVIFDEPLMLAIRPSVRQHPPMTLFRILPFVPACVALLLTVPAAAAPREPTGKWVVDYEDQACIATREYGSAANPLDLALKASPSGGVMQLSIIRKGSRGSAGVDELGNMSLDGGRDVPISMLSFGSSNGLYATRVNLPSESFEAVRTARTLRVRGQSIDETLVLAQLPELMKQIDACVVDLQEAWNMGPNASAKVRSRASGSLVGIFTSADYPAAAGGRMATGWVALVLLIDERGKVADCTVTATSGAAALDSQACAIVSKRANFKPAMGFDGKPTRDSYHQRINWTN